MQSEMKSLNLEFSEESWNVVKDRMGRTRHRKREEWRDLKETSNVFDRVRGQNERL